MAGETQFLLTGPKVPYYVRYTFSILELIAVIWAFVDCLIFSCTDFDFDCSCIPEASSPANEPL